MNREDIRRICTQQWATALDEGPHTSFKMVEIMMNVLGVQPRAFLQNPAALGTFSRDFVVEDGLYNHYLDAWNSRTGRCTSFAIRVAKRLEGGYPIEGFYFQYYDLGGHRVARCDRTHFVIDSESRTGVEELPDGADWIDTPNNTRGHWGFRENYSVFNEDGPDGPSRRIYPISPELALGICLEEIAKRAILVCCFRSISYQGENLRPEYHGVVRWRLTEKRIELTPNLNSPREFSSITFGTRNGTSQTNRECVRNLVAFIRGCGIEQQWRADGIDQFNMELWKAALRVWGYPVWATHAG